MKISLPKFDACKLLVVGDVMLDRYWTGETSRISPEAPVPVVKVEVLEERAGGAANVGLNIASLGCDVRVAGVTGNDQNAGKLESLLSKAAVTSKLLGSDQCETITKLRVMSRHQQLIRLDFESRSLQAGALDLSKYVSSQIKEVDVIVLSDYNKGSLSESKTMISAARKANKPVIVDPKGTDFSKYKAASLLTPNQAEFEAIAGVSRNDEDMENRARLMIDELQLEALLITRGEKGMMLVERNQPVFSLSTRARDVFDVTGAGDTVVGVLAAGIAAGENYRDAAYLANIAAGVTVSKLGAQCVTAQELEAEIFSSHAFGNGVVDKQALMDKVTSSRERGEKIVFTNGCFDLLHAGHVSYLQQAAALGDRLIIAVNDDDSVRKLKGEGRPINSVANRMSVLSALSCVDWVVSFGEDTPRNLIAEILPDILVKGGDYKPEDIAGYSEVVNNGGSVEIIPFLHGFSTSEIIRLISEKP